MQEHYTVFKPGKPNCCKTFAGSVSQTCALRLFSLPPGSCIFKRTPDQLVDRPRRDRRQDRPSQRIGQWLMLVYNAAFWMNHFHAEEPGTWLAQEADSRSR